MDIVVTIPKTEYENDDKERIDVQEKRLVQFWMLARRPKRLNVGDRVYFVKYGRIESSMKVIEIKVRSKMTCETTGREWSGSCQIVMDNRQAETGIEAKGFQGFRYKWW